MDSTELRIFEAVARTGGMKRAADELHTVQSNVTARVKALEDDLGCALFERHSRGVALTHAGAPLASADSETLAVALALLIGKPLGILLGGALAMRGLGAALPAGMAPRDLAVVGLVAAMGFSVPLFAIGATLPGGALSEGARLGLLASLIAAPLALLLARAIGRRVA